MTKQNRYYPSSIGGDLTPLSLHSGHRISSNILGSIGPSDSNLNFNLQFLHWAGYSVNDIRIENELL